MLWLVAFVVVFALFVWWVDRQNKKHPGNMLRSSGSAMGNVKHTDPLDRTDTE